MTIQAIAFDLDGTLIDSAPDIAAALNHALESQGLARVASALSRTWIGDGPDRLIERALMHLQAEPTPMLRGALRTAFDSATLAAPLEHGRVFTGIVALLTRWFHARPMVVVTNKPTALSQRVLDAAGLLTFFDAVHGADAPAQRKPAPALLLAAASKLNIEPASLLMVGDSENDLNCAQAAGCPAAWVSWGYGPLPDDAPATTWRVQTPDELHERLARQ
jgi:phosphoglycolate phosphatase